MLNCLFKRKKYILSPEATDWVGYDGITNFIKEKRILELEGQLVEIGAFLGGGTYHLAKFLESQKSKKILYVIDVFDPNFDWTTNENGCAMAELYAKVLERYKGKSQWEIFKEVTKECKNIVVLNTDSKEAEIPADKLCFGFVDGNHAPDYVENDFFLIWNKLTKGGSVAFHDYEWDLPQTTQKIKELVHNHSHLIKETFHDQKRHILYVIKK